MSAPGLALLPAFFFRSVIRRTVSRQGTPSLRMCAARRRGETMGLSSAKTKSTNAPSAYNRPFIDAGTGALQAAYGQSQGLASNVVDQFTRAMPQLGQQAFGANPGLSAATDYNTSVLRGDYMGADNPGLASVMNRTGADVTARVQAAFSNAGRTGSGANQAALSRGLGDALGGIQYGDYNNERTRMAQAASLAPTLNLAQYAGPAAYLDLARSSAGLGQDVAQQYAGGLGSLVGGYNTQTQKTSQSLGSVLGQLAGSGLSAWASGGFKGI